MTIPTVILADDHAIVLEGVRRLLEGEYEVVAVAEDGEQLVSFMEDLQPDLAVIDVSMPKLNGIQALPKIRERSPGTRVVVLTMHRDPAYAAAALREGAHGYVLKHSSAEELGTALRDVLEGKVYVSSAIASKVDSALKSSRNRPVSLTARQRDVLRLIAEGRILKQIATELAISIKTVEYHKYRLMEVLGASSTAELIRIAVARGIPSSRVGDE